MKEGQVERALVCFSLIDTAGIVLSASGLILENTIYEEGTIADWLGICTPVGEGGLWIWEGQPIKKDEEKVEFIDGEWRRPTYDEWHRIIMGRPLWPSMCPMEESGDRKII
jgi:hypothetical protein